MLCNVLHIYLLTLSTCSGGGGGRCDGGVGGVGGGCCVVSELVDGNVKVRGVAVAVCGLWRMLTVAGAQQLSSSSSVGQDGGREVVTSLLASQ